MIHAVKKTCAAPCLLSAVGLAPMPTRAGSAMGLPPMPTRAGSAVGLTPMPTKAVSAMGPHGLTPMPTRTVSAIDSYGLAPMPTKAVSALDPQGLAPMPTRSGSAYQGLCYNVHDMKFLWELDALHLMGLVHAGFLSDKTPSGSDIRICLLPQHDRIRHCPMT